MITERKVKGTYLQVERKILILGYLIYVMQLHAAFFEYAYLKVRVIATLLTVGSGRSHLCFLFLRRLHLHLERPHHAHAN